MRTPILLVAFSLFVNQLQAQVTSARSLTKRINPPATAPAQPARPVAPGVVPAPPADPAKVKAGHDQAELKRLEYQKKRAGEGSPIAQFDLGLRYMKGNGVEQNLTEAVKWFELAEKNGNT